MARPSGLDAVVDDELLDVTLLHDVPLWWLLRHAPAFYRGTHPALGGIPTYRGRRLTARLPHGPPMPLEADGELVGRLPATIEVMPQALRLQC